MRVIVAALLVVSGIFAAVALVSVTGIGEGAPVVVGFGLALLLLCLSVFATYLINPWWSNPLGLMTPKEFLRQLEDEGLLESTDFQARRAFGLQEYGDEGLHYFLELVDGRVLYLCGQYLYDYEPISDDPEKRPRRFPCIDFTIVRHRREGYVLDILCKGAVIEPEFIAPPFTRRDWRSVGAPEDGQILSDQPYYFLVKLVQRTVEPGRHASDAD